MGIVGLRNQVPTGNFTEMREHLMEAYPAVAEWHRGVCPVLPNPACGKDASCGSLVATLKGAYKDEDREKGVIIVEENPFPLLVVGDLHGDLHALLDILSKWIKEGWMDQRMKFDNVSVLFTGDLVDRGCYGPYVMFIVLHLKKLNHDKVWWTLGNHDNSISQWSVTNQYFSQQLKQFSGESLAVLAEQLTKRVPTGIVFQPDTSQGTPLEVPPTVIFACHGMPDMSRYHAGDPLHQYKALFPHYIARDMNQWQWGRCMKIAYTGDGPDFVPHHWWSHHTGPENIWVLRGHDHKSSPWEQCYHDEEPHQSDLKRKGNNFSNFSTANSPKRRQPPHAGGGSGSLHIFTHTGSPRLLGIGMGFGFTHYDADRTITIYTCEGSEWTAQKPTLA